MFGDCHTIHAEIAQSINKGFNGLGAVQQGEVGMIMEMNEFGHSEPLAPVWLAGSFGTVTGIDSHIKFG
jgi:hypothetical protein